MMTTLINQTSPDNYIKALHRNTDGYITLFKKMANGTVKQRHYKLNQINDDVIRDFVDFDCYVSLNSFFRRKRGNAHLRTIHNLYVDLDCYDEKINMSVESVMYQLEQDYFNIVIPTPNLVTYSGRGIQLAWNIEAISGLAIERWGIVQRAICNALKPFGADSKALDAARVFRLPASINSKNNQIVTYDHLHENEYDLVEIGKEYFGILPKPKREQAPKKPQKARKKRSSVYSGFNLYSLAQARLSDLETLIELRKGKMNGCREQLLFLARHFALSITKDKQAAIQKITFLNGLFVEPVSTWELLNSTASAEMYHVNGGFSATNTKIIEWLEITPAEQTKLSTIISKDEKRSRDRKAKEKARRAAGTDTRAQHNRKRLRAVIRNAKRIKLAQAIYPNMSIRETAAKVGLSKTYVHQLLRDIDMYVDACANAYVDECGKVSSGVSALFYRVAKGLSIMGLDVDLAALSQQELRIIQQQLIDYGRLYDS